MEEEKATETNNEVNEVSTEDKIAFINIMARIAAAIKSYSSELRHFVYFKQNIVSRAFPELECEKLEGWGSRKKFEPEHREIGRNIVDALSLLPPVVIEIYAGAFAKRCHISFDANCTGMCGDGINAHDASKIDLRMAALKEWFQEKGMYSVFVKAFNDLHKGQTTYKLGDYIPPFITAEKPLSIKVIPGVLVAASWLVGIAVDSKNDFAFLKGNFHGAPNALTLGIASLVFMAAAFWVSCSSSRSEEEKENLRMVGFTFA